MLNEGKQQVLDSHSQSHPSHPSHIIDSADTHTNSYNFYKTSCGLIMFSERFKCSLQLTPKTTIYTFLGTKENTQTNKMLGTPSQGEIKA